MVSCDGEPVGQKNGHAMHVEAMTFNLRFLKLLLENRNTNRQPAA